MLSESEVDPVLAAFLEAHDMDVIATEIKDLSLDGDGQNKDKNEKQDREKEKKLKKKEKKEKSKTLRLPHFHHKAKDKTSSSSGAGETPVSHKSKSSTLRTIKKLGGVGLKSPGVKSPSSPVIKSSNLNESSKA